MQAKCPKCGKSIKSKDTDLFSLIFLFGDVSYSKKNPSKCDVCGNKIKKRY